MQDSEWGFDWDHYMRGVEMRLRLGGYRRIDGSIPWNDRFALYRHNYGVKTKLVDAGHSSWFRSDPYAIADWATVFTPIEQGVWEDIRCAGVWMWPQLPVGRYFLDFGNPVAKVAIECDGAQWHQDKAKDAARDRELEAQGWEVMRIPGWRCKNGCPDLDLDMTEDQLDERRQFINNKTPAYEIAWAAHVIARFDEAPVSD